MKKSSNNSLIWNLKRRVAPVLSLCLQRSHSRAPAPFRSRLPNSSRCRRVPNNNKSYHININKIKKLK
jgi:hypothetical protein